MRSVRYTLVACLASAMACTAEPIPAQPATSSQDLTRAELPAREAKQEPGTASPTSLPEAPTPPPLPPPPPERVWGQADLDPDNDDIVAPPDAVPECHQRLEAAGVKFRPAELPLRQLRNDVPTCGAHDAVIYLQGPLGVKVHPAALVTCQLALGLAGFESVLQEVAQREVGSTVHTMHQGGTYSCRKMARFNLASEHSYGNAIDVYSLTLKDGRKLSVLKHYGALDPPPSTSASRFLRAVASAAYDRNVFSVALSPHWDALHKNHFHFDMVRYRVDGTRP